MLANTVQQKEWEDRFSGANVSWAKTVPMHIPPEKRTSCIVSSHPAKLDDFISTARQEMGQMDKERGRSVKVKRPSVRKKLSEKADTSAAPKPPGKSKAKGQER